MVVVHESSASTWDVFRKHPHRSLKIRKGLTRNLMHGYASVRDSKPGLLKMEIPAFRSV